MSQKDQLRLRDYLVHIVDAIERIEHYVEGMDEHAFRQNQLVQDAVIRNIEVIGEASRNIQVRHPEFAISHPELPLTIAYQMRNAVAHGYFSVDWEIVWRTIQRNLPMLKRLIQTVLNEL